MTTERIVLFLTVSESPSSVFKYKSEYKVIKTEIHWNVFRNYGENHSGSESSVACNMRLTFCLNKYSHVCAFLKVVIN